MIRIVLKESNNLAYFNDLYDVLNEESINTAAVTVVFYYDDGTEVSGEIWPKTLGYLQGSQGDYVAVLDDDLDLVIGSFYTAVVTIDDGPGRRLVETHELEIVDRQP